MNDLSQIPRPFVCLVRHGQTELALASRLNGLGDVPLTAVGEAQAASLRPFLARVEWDRVFSSPLHRVRRTAELAGFPAPEIIQNLHEFDCGEYEGLTPDEVQGRQPGWDFWRDGCKGGEIPATAAERLEAILQQLRAEPGATLVFSHAGTIRIMVARWLGLPGHMGSGIGFDPAHLGIVCKRGGYPAILIWNDGEYLPPEHRHTDPHVP